MNAPRMALSSADAVAVASGAPAVAAGSAGPNSDTALGRKLVYANGLAFLTGVADVATHCTAGCYASMMTGNTINLISALATNRLTDGLFFLGMVTHYVAGTIGFRLLSARRSPSTDALAPCVLVLFAAVDGLVRASASRWPLMLLALSFGYINSLSSERTGVGSTPPSPTCRRPLPRGARISPLPRLPAALPWAGPTSQPLNLQSFTQPTPIARALPPSAGLITCMVTGHFQKIGNAIADATSGPLSSSQRRAALTSASVVLAFALGVGTGCGLRRAAIGPTAVGAAFRRMPTFTALGAAFAALVTCGERAHEPAQLPGLPAGSASRVDALGMNSKPPLAGQGVDEQSSPVRAIS
jgi:uncharacterized membrane protein YoaK (UPF0700 family)